MKFKSFSALLLSFLLLVLFSACGRNTSPENTQSPDTMQSHDTTQSENSDQSSEPSQPDDSTDTDNNPYDLDYESADPQAMSSERLTKAELLDAYNHFGNMDADERSNITYEDIVEYIGCDASEFYGLSSRSYVWYASDDQYAQMNATFLNDGGDWTNPFMSHGNLTN